MNEVLPNDWYCHFLWCVYLLSMLSFLSLLLWYFDDIFLWWPGHCNWVNLFCCRVWMPTSAILSVCLYNRQISNLIGLMQRTCWFGNSLLCLIFLAFSLSSFFYSYSFGSNQYNTLLVLSLINATLCIGRVLVRVAHIFNWASSFFVYNIMVLGLFLGQNIHELCTNW